jgi:hypothetical protein
MSKPRPRPFPAFIAPLVRIVAAPIKYGWRYTVAPQGHGKVTAYTLDRARETARRFSRRIIEVGPPAAFRRRA